MSTTQAYAIANWREVFETSESRKYKSLPWVAVPTKQDGNGFRRVAAHERGTIAFAGFMLIVQVASKCPMRGVLADEQGPLDAEDLHFMTGHPVAAFEAAFEVMTMAKVNWLELIDMEVTSVIPEDVRGSSEESPGVSEDVPDVTGDTGRSTGIQNITEHNITEHNIPEASAKNNEATDDIIRKVNDWSVDFRGHEISSGELSKLHRNAAAMSGQSAEIVQAVDGLRGKCDFKSVPYVWVAICGELGELGDKPSLPKDRPKRKPTPKTAYEVQCGVDNMEIRTINGEKVRPGDVRLVGDDRQNISFAACTILHDVIASQEYA